jgi:signal transduction histidine kinase
VDVLNDLLNYDKIETGTLRLEFSSVPIWQVLKKTTAGFAMQAKEKKVSFTLTGKLWDGQLSPSELAEYQALRVVGDSMRISQVLRNICSNALKFTPTSGSVSIHGKTINLYPLPRHTPYALAPRILISSPNAHMPILCCLTSSPILLLYLPPIS